MYLSKSERIYKKRLFRYLKVKKKTKQKELTKNIAKTELYKRGGFKKVYYSIKNSRVLIYKLTNAMSKVIYAARMAGKSIMQLAQVLKSQKTDKKEKRSLGYSSRTVIVDEIPFEHVTTVEENV